MRNPIPFDTHAYVKRLVAAGVPETQAEVHVGALAGFALANLIAKDDLLGPEQGLRTDIRADMKELELRLTLRVGAMLAAAVAIMVAVVKLL